MRAVAREAGVDSALLVHYFVNRRGLLREALRPEQPIVFDFAQILSTGSPQESGERLVAHFLAQIDAPAAQPNLMLRVVGMGLDDELAVDLLRELIDERFVDPLATALTAADRAGAEPWLAAEQIATLLLALLIARASSAFERVASLPDARVVGLYGALVQQVLESTASAPAPGA